MLSSKYSVNSKIFNFCSNVIVKKLEQRSQSAGNIFSDKDETSETIRNEIVTNIEHTKDVSVHVPKHNKPLNDEEFGHYLAGLIDGGGHFSKIKQVIIVFSYSDAFLAYYIKGKLGYGNVKKINKNAYLLAISNEKGVTNIINLINGKLRTNQKYNEIVNNILKSSNNGLLDNFTFNTSNDFNNHWLAGFSDADASFQIKIINRDSRDKPEIRLNFQIDQKDDYILKLIKGYLGGNIGYKKLQETYYYGSTSFGSARKVITYFDKFHLQSRKHVNYLKWRKVYLLIMDKKHLTEKGLSLITKTKAHLNHHD